MKARASRVPLATMLLGGLFVSVCPAAVSVSLFPLREFYHPGEPIAVLMTLKNTGRVPIEIPISGYFPQHVLKKYPKHPQAERALYFLALDAVQAGDKRLAESSCEDFIKRYPKSGWRNHIQSVLSDEVPKLKDK